MKPILFLFKGSFLLIALSFLAITSVNAQGISIEGGLMKIFSAKPGDVIKGHVTLVNPTEEDVVVKVGLKDVQFDCSGGFKLLDDYDLTHGGSQWISDVESEKFIPAKTKYEYPFTITVPNTKGLQGSFLAVLKVQNPDPKKLNLAKNAVGLTSKTNYVIGILVHVDKEPVFDINFENMDLAYQTLQDNQVKKILSITLSNTTIFAYKTALNMEVYNAAGDLVLEKKSLSKHIYADSCRDISLDLSALAAGTYQCVLTAEADGEFVGTNLSLSIK